MGQIKDILKQLEQNPANVRFSDLCKVCVHYFGKARQSGSSHRIYKMAVVTEYTKLPGEVTRE